MKKVPNIIKVRYMSSKTKETIVSGIIIYAVLGWAFWQTMSMLPTSALFPRVIIVLMTVLNTIMVIRSFGIRWESEMNLEDLKIPFIVFMAITIYVIIFRYLGYFIATSILLASLMLFFKVRPFYKIIAVTIGYCAFVYILFVLQLNVML